MKIPKYVQEIMGRSKYEFSLHTDNELYAAGYTIRIKKASPYTYARTFNAEMERLVKWANREAGIETAYILDICSKTNYRNLFAVVTIFDPIMKEIEKYIPKQ